MAYEHTVSVFRALEHTYPAREELAALLRHDDEALVHAAVLHVDRRLRDGEPFDRLQTLLPADLVALPPESQLVLAALAVDGFGLPSPDVPESLERERPDGSLPPAVRLGWLRAALLDRPDTIRRFEGAPILWTALAGLPCERVITTGLLDRLVESADPNVREQAIGYLRTGLEHGWIGRLRAQEIAARLADDSVVPIAIEALRFLGAAWSFGLPLPRLRARDDLEHSCELVRLFRARRDLSRLRRPLADASSALLPTVACEQLAALGECGDAADIPWIVSEMRDEPSVLGPVGLEALVALKRRGVSPDDEHARALLQLFLDCPAWNAVAVAEVLSSRADVVLDALDALVTTEPRWSSIVALLEALGTRRAVQRLRQAVTREEERAGAWYAIRALGRLGIHDAEAEILARFDDEPDACLDALRYVGGEQTVRALSERIVRDGPSPAWRSDAAQLLFQLDPSPLLFEELSRRGLLTSAMIDALPAHSAIAQSREMRAIATQHGHPLRGPAIRALGLVGGPLAASVLGEALADPEDTIRDEALRALRVLGPRLEAQGAVRPACLASSDDAASALVADAILHRLRDRTLEPGALIRLLDSLLHLQHPQLVAVLRPYLRNKASEIRKRVLACLASAGPAAAAWALPWISDEDITVARQALELLARVKAPGLTGPVAKWLDGRNMNMKKVAAETLASTGDWTVAPKLLYWLETHDNPGFRQLLVAALKAILGTWFVTAIVDRLRAAEDLRSQKLLIEALGGALSATEVAALVSSSEATTSPSWTNELLRAVYAEECSLSSGSLTDLDTALEHRGLRDRIPIGVARDGETAGRAPALRAGVQLRRALRAPSRDEAHTAALRALLGKANVRGAMIVGALSPLEAETLLDTYPSLDEEARAGVRQLLAASPLNPVARLRTARLVGEPPDEAPAALLRSLTTMSVGVARQLTDSPDRLVQVAAERALVLGDKVDLALWPTMDPTLLLPRLVREGAFDVAFAWSRQNGHLQELVRILHATCGSALALAQIERWLDSNADLLPVLLPAISKVGPAADGLLERIATSAHVELHLRERIVRELGSRVSNVPLRAFLRALLADPHAALREHAARVLVQLARPDDRAAVLEAFLEGAFREAFTIASSHADLPFLEAARRSASAARRERLARLLADLDDPQQIPLLVDLWKMSDREVKEKCRDVLRAIDPLRVLAFLERDLAAGDASVLDLLGPMRSIPEALIARADLGTDSATWERFFERMSGEGALHAPGLATALSRRFGDGGSRAAVRLFVQLDDWSREERVGELAAALEPALAGDDRDALLAAITEATQSIGVALRARVLASIGRPSDTAIVLALLDTVLENRFVRNALPPAMAAAVDRRMHEEQRDPERMRRILNYRAAHAASETDRAALVDMLEAALRHASPRVRRHAHRLLRTHADRARYLGATRLLLGDRDPTTLRSAIRVLAFGRALDAVPAICELLHHAHAVVRAAAREGLLAMGEDGLSPITRALAHARPDHRQRLSDVLDEIRRGRRDDGASAIEEAM